MKNGEKGKKASKFYNLKPNKLIIFRSHFFLIILGRYNGHKEKIFSFKNN
jgi:hypothetical protein